MILPHISPESAPWLALTSSFCFANSSFIYRRLAKRVSPLWMNCFKACVAAVCFSLFVLFYRTELQFPSPAIWAVLMLSGFIGLNLGDYFMLKSYKEIGPGRTMMITAFNPLFLSFMGYLLFGDSLSPRIFFAVLCLSFVLIILGHENYHVQRKWSLSGYLHALCSAVLDSSGLLLTRYCFKATSDLDPFLANWYRVLGALIGFGVMNFAWRRIGLWRNFRALETHEQGLAVFGSFLGTFFALGLWLTALMRGHMGVVSSMGGFAPLYATTVECLRHRRAPGPHILLAALFFLTGFLLIINPPFVSSVLQIFGLGLSS